MSEKAHYVWLHARAISYRGVKKEHQPLKRDFSVTVQPDDVAEWAIWPGSKPVKLIDWAAERLAWRIRKMGYLDRLVQPHRAEFELIDRKPTQTDLETDYWNLKLTYNLPVSETFGVPGSYRKTVFGGKWQLAIARSWQVPIGRSPLDRFQSIGERWWPEMESA